MAAEQLLAARLTQLAREIRGYTFSRSDRQRLTSRIESIYLDAVTVDGGVATISATVFQKLSQCITLLEEDQALSDSTVVAQGRPRILLSREHLLDLGLTPWSVAIARVIGISRSTLARRMKEMGLLVSNKYSCISDEELDDLVRNISLQFPGCGHKMLQGHLRDRGIVVQQTRARESLRRTDPEGIAMRKSLNIKRRQYNVSSPLELWHIDGNHKLIR